MTRKEKKVKTLERRAAMRIAWLERLNQLMRERGVPEAWDILCQEIAKQVTDTPNRAQDVRFAFAALCDELNAIERSKPGSSVEQEIEPETLKLSGNMVEIPIVEDNIGEDNVII